MAEDEPRKTDDIEETHEDEIDEPETWKETFTAFQAMADENGRPPDEYCFTFPVEIPQQGRLSFRINGAFLNPQSKLEVMSVNVYRNDRHCQELIVRATWEGNQVSKVETDSSYVFGAKFLVSDSFIAKAALAVVKVEKDMQTKGPEDAARPPANGLQAPGNYSPRLN